MLPVPYLEDYFENKELFKKYFSFELTDQKVIPVIQLGYICYFKSSFEYDGVKYDLC